MKIVFFSPSGMKVSAYTLRWLCIGFSVLQALHKIQHSLVYFLMPFDQT
jgi:hypothetical protein